MKTGKAVLAVVTGLVAGAMLGVIFASDRETASRKNLEKMGQRLSDAFEDMLRRRIDALGAGEEKTASKHEGSVLFRRKSEANG